MKTVVLFLSCILLGNAEIFQTRLHRLAPRRFLTTRAGINPKFAHQKIGSKRSVQSPMYNEFTGYYALNITLGTPPQKFSVALRMDTSDLFVVDVACTQQECKCFPDAGYTRKQYDPKKSTTYQKQGDYFDYFDETATGFYAFDTMQIGGFAIRQEFGLSQYVDLSYGYEPTDGYFGFGLPDKTSTVVPPIKNLLSQLDQPLFTIWVDPKKKIGSQVGIMTFGGIDTQHCSSQVGYAPLANRANWEFKVDSFKFGAYSASTPILAVFEMETDEIMVPHEFLDRMMQEIGATCDDFTYICTVDCSAVPTLPDLVLNIGGAKIAIPASRYTKGTRKCEITLIDSYESYWYLGGPFPASACSVFDVQNERIGFTAALSA